MNGRRLDASLDFTSMVLPRVAEVESCSSLPPLCCITGIKKARLFGTLAKVNEKAFAG